MSSTRSEAVEAAGRVLAAGYAAQARMSPREQAEAAWEPTCGYSIDELEALIRDLRRAEIRRGGRRRNRSRITSRRASA